MKEKILFLVGFAIFVFAFTPLVIDAMERESQWRSDRLCRIYEVCDPKAGP